jgi:hypothetical protein
MVKPLPLLLTIVGFIAALVVAVALSFGLSTRIGEYRLRTTRIDEYRLEIVKSTFQGLSRDEAYARLNKMQLTPMAWSEAGGPLAHRCASPSDSLADGRRC